MRRDADSSLELLARLRFVNMPFNAHPAIGVLAHDALDALEHARREHRANDERRWREVVPHDVPRQLDL